MTADLFIIRFEPRRFRRYFDFSGLAAVVAFAGFSLAFVAAMVAAV